MQIQGLHFFLLQNFKKIHNCQVSDNQQKWLLPVGQSEKLKFSTNQGREMNFLSLALTRAPHITELQNRSSSGHFLPNAKVSKSSFRINTVDSWNQFSHSGKLNTLQLRTNVRPKATLCILYSCHRLPRKNIHIVCLYILVAKQENWSSQQTRAQSAISFFLFIFHLKTF